MMALMVWRDAGQSCFVDLGLFALPNPEHSAPSSTREGHRSRNLARWCVEKESFEKQRNAGQLVVSGDR
jgi:hypothetical protein